MPRLGRSSLILRIPQSSAGISSSNNPVDSVMVAKYSPIDLEARMLYPEGKHAVAIVTLPSGEQVKGPLVHSDDFVISLRDASGWYRSFLRDQVKVELQNPLAAHRELLSKLKQTDV